MTEWTVGERKGDVTPSTKRVQLPHWDAFEINVKTTKDMALTIERWNAMRARLIELGEMKSK